ncbi:hypothetical protein VP01_3230g7, partial [Puccinia sorghi]
MISKTYKYRIIPIEHNCIGGKFQAIESKLASRPNQESTAITWHINHSSNNSYIVNGVSHHSPEHHRVLGNIQISPIADKMFEEALKVGKDVWEKEAFPQKYTIMNKKAIKKPDKGKTKIPNPPKNNIRSMTSTNEIPKNAVQYEYQGNQTKIPYY